jgi:EAL domain-containing protein (putative c-di-GMP-specific phosphodiesterase class I)
LAVIAEGVETEAPMDLLASSGCHAYQGYLFSRPVDIDGVGPLVRSGFDRFAKMLEADVSLETG